MVSIQTFSYFWSPTHRYSATEKRPVKIVRPVGFANHHTLGHSVFYQELAFYSPKNAVLNMHSDINININSTFIHRPRLPYTAAPQTLSNSPTLTAVPARPHQQSPSPTATSSSYPHIPDYFPRHDSQTHTADSRKSGSAHPPCSVPYPWR